MLKVFATDTLWRIINDTIQIFGGKAYFTDEPYERMLRDARINMIGEGANDVLRVFAGAHRHARRGARAARRAGSGPSSAAKFLQAHRIRRPPVERDVQLAADQGPQPCVSSGSHAPRANLSAYWDRTSNGCCALIARRSSIGNINSPALPTRPPRSTSRPACSIASTASRRNPVLRLTPASKTAPLPRKTIWRLPPAVITSNPPTAGHDRT